MVKLEPCPFCGSKTAYIAQNYMGQHYVRCPDCGCTMWGLDTDEEVTEKQAAACWNKRADVRPVVLCRDCEMASPCADDREVYCTLHHCYKKKSYFCADGKGEK